jgi:hypothetical protein
MKTIEAVVEIPADGRLTLQLPPDVPRGRRRIVLVVEEQVAEIPATTLDDFPVDYYGPWPEGLSLRREDIYDERGR